MTYDNAPTYGLGQFIGQTLARNLDSLTEHVLTADLSASLMRGLDDVAEGRIGPRPGFLDDTDDDPEDDDPEDDA